MKRQDTTHVVVQQPHNSDWWRLAVEFIGIDVHKRESQVCILAAKAEVVEKRIRTERGRFAGIRPADAVPDRLKTDGCCARRRSRAWA